MKKLILNHQVWLILLAAFCYFPFLGYNQLFDWDEINFAESAREMLVTGDYFRVQVNFQSFWEKPRLFFWLQAIAMKLFGVNAFAARLPNALAGLLTVGIVFSIGSRAHSVRVGWLWALCYIGSLLPQVYHRSGIIDPVFNLFIFLSIYFLHQSIHPSNHNRKDAMAAGIFAGLAILTKGPVGLLIVVLVFIVRWSTERLVRDHICWRLVLWFASATLVVSTVWYGIDLIQNGPAFLVEFVRYQWDLLTSPVAGHQQP